MTGNPEYSRRPPGFPTWVKDRQTGGGASIPCTWKLHIASSVNPTNVKDVIEARLVDVAGHEGMEVKVEYQLTIHGKTINILCQKENKATK